MKDRALTVMQAGLCLLLYMTLLSSNGSGDPVPLPGLKGNMTHPSDSLPYVETELCSLDQECQAGGKIQPAV